jgi:hypothetical protein
VAQNLDIPHHYHGHPTNLRVRGAEPDDDAFVLTLPGLIGANGTNRRAVAITCNTLLDLAHATAGLPVARVVRGVLSCRSFDESEAFLREVPHASGQNYIFGGRERALSLECSAHRVSEFVPWEGAKVTFHTNHALANDDFSASGRGRTRGPPQCARFAAVARRLRQRAAPLDLDALKEILSAREGTERLVDNPFTYACTIMELGGASPALHIAPGRPSETPFQTLRFDGDASRRAGMFAHPPTRCR